MRARIVLLFLAAGALVRAQAPPFSPAVRGFIKVDAPVVALTHVRVIDGCGGEWESRLVVVHEPTA